MFVDAGLRQHAFSLKVMQATLRRPNMPRSHLGQATGRFLLEPDATAEPAVRAIDLTLIANTDFALLLYRNDRLVWRSISGRSAASIA